MADWTAASDRAERHAPFLARQLRRFPDLAALLRAGEGEAALAAAKQAGDGSADLAVALRRERSALALALAVGDLAGAFPLDRVMGELSDLADRALDKAIAHAIARRVPDAQPAGFVALALGKHGSRELNYSSDIDPILLYDPDSLPRRPRDEPGEAAQRYARDVVQLLGAVTEEGHVFRVDLRLRPASEVSPLAVPVGGALSHYEGSALAWERAAFIRARAAAGDLPLGVGFLRAIETFVWRRSLDFGAIDEIRRLTRRIRDRQPGPRQPAPGFDLKLGRGGIREAEFLAQTLQLIHGGRDRSLRSAAIEPALTSLAQAGLVAPDAAAALARGYHGLRVAEHRLQMVDDRQTHILPSGEALDEVARLSGMPDAAALLNRLAGLCAPVAEAFDALTAEDAASVRRDDPLTGGQDALALRVAGWTGERFRVLRGGAATEAFEAIRPGLLEAFRAAPAPEEAATRMETLLERLPSALNMFRLLQARPALLELLVRVLSLAPPLAEQLGRRPALLDALIDRSALDLPGPVDDLAARMETAAREAGLEARLDAMRLVTGEARFALGVQLVEGSHDALAIGEGLARLAEAGVRQAVHAVTAEFSARHGRVAGGELVVVALGRLGGSLLTHASDLDLVYLFTGGLEGESDGPRALGATLYFNRLAQRVGAALSVPTADGALYEVDVRLRPQGDKGPLAVSVDSFRRYQLEDAWTWEHMALSRARPITGSRDARDAVEAVIAEAVRLPRPPRDLRADVLSMRRQMAEVHSPAGPLDAKRLRGGLVDLEFLLQYLQLRDRAWAGPRLSDALVAAARAGLASPALQEAHDTLNRILIASRLLAPDLQHPHAAAAGRLAAACGMASYAALGEALASARRHVAADWRTILKEQIIP